MTIDISSIVESKLAQMEADGVIRKKIEDALEKSILSAVTSELDSYNFTRELRDEMKKAVSGVAEQTGLAAYNGFIAQKARQIVSEVLSDDLTAKIQTALDGVLLRKHEGVKLSDIFEKYNKWVCENVDESDKYDRSRYTAELERRESYGFIYYEVKLAERPDATKSYSHDDDEIPDVSFHLSRWRGEKFTISSVRLKGNDISKSLRIGVLSEIEAFIVNLFYNKTEIEVDMEDADDYGYFDIDI